MFHSILPFSILSTILLSSCASVSINAYQENTELAPNRLPTKISVLPTKAIFEETAPAGKQHARGKLYETLYLEPNTGHSRSLLSPPKNPPSGKALSHATNKQLCQFIKPNPAWPQQELNPSFLFCRDVNA